MKTSILEKHYSDEDRLLLASKGEALPDGSFPIKNKTDLEHAIKCYGLSNDPKTAKKFIIKRAKELNAVDILPDKWNIKECLTFSDYIKESSEYNENSTIINFSKTFTSNISLDDIESYFKIKDSYAKDISIDIEYSLHIITSDINVIKLTFILDTINAKFKINDKDYVLNLKDLENFDITFDYNFNNDNIAFTPSIVIIDFKNSKIKIS